MNVYLCRACMPPRARISSMATSVTVVMATQGYIVKQVGALWIVLWTWHAHICWGFVLEVAHDWVYRVVESRLKSPMFISQLFWCRFFLCHIYIASSRRKWMWVCPMYVWCDVSRWHQWISLLMCSWIYRGALWNRWVCCQCFICCTFNVTDFQSL